MAGKAVAEFAFDKALSSEWRASLTDNARDSLPAAPAKCEEAPVELRQLTEQELDNLEDMYNRAIGSEKQTSPGTQPTV